MHRSRRRGRPFPPVMHDTCRRINADGRRRGAPAVIRSRGLDAHGPHRGRESAQLHGDPTARRGGCGASGSRPFIAATSLAKRPKSARPESSTSLEATRSPSDRCRCARSRSRCDQRIANRRRLTMPRRSAPSRAAPRDPTLAVFRRPMPSVPSVSRGHSSVAIRRCLYPAVTDGVESDAAACASGDERSVGRQEMCIAGSRRARGRTGRPWPDGRPARLRRQADGRAGRLRSVQKRRRPAASGTRRTRRRARGGRGSPRRP